MLSIFLDLIDEQSDRELFEELYNKYEKPMWYLAYSILNDHHRAEDATQDTFLKIAIHIKTLRDKPPHKVRNYLLISVRNRAYDILKKELRLNYAGADYFDNLCDESSSKDFENLETNALVIKILKQLPQKFTDVMFMHLVLGMKNNEIARVLNISYGSATTQIFRGKKIFAELYEKELNKR